jgi:hypothetical protein
VASKRGVRQRRDERGSKLASGRRHRNQRSNRIPFDLQREVGIYEALFRQIFDPAHPLFKIFPILIQDLDDSAFDVKSNPTKIAALPDNLCQIQHPPRIVILPFHSGYAGRQIV